jgi:hypothetical protein
MDLQMKGGGMTIVKRMLLSGLVLFLLSGLVAKPAGAQPVLDQIAENTPLNVLSTKLKALASDLIEEASQEGEYLLQQGAMEVLIALQTLDSILQKQQNNAWKNLDRTIQDSFRQLDKRLQTLETGILRYEDFLYLDISSLMDRIPLLKAEKSLRSVNGISQAYKRSGNYRLELLGSAFGPGVETIVKVGDFAVPPANLESSRANQLHVSVTAEHLTGFFQDGDVVLVPVEVTVFEMRERSWLGWVFSGFESHERAELVAYRFPIRLLPKTAGTYSLVELQQVKAPSDPVQWSQWSPTLSKSKIGYDTCKGCNSAKKGSVCAAIPQNAEVVLSNGVPVVDRWEGGGCNAYCGWYGQPHISAGKVCQVWGNWRRSHGGSARLRFQYRLLEDTIVRSPRTLHLVGETDPREAERLEFGRLYETELSPEFASYNLVLKLFNGEEVVITPKIVVNGDLAQVELDLLGGSAHRLLLKLGGA